MKTFSEFLEDKHIELHPAVLDDDLPDSFDNWVTELQADDWMQYGEEALTSQRKEIVKELEEIKRKPTEEVLHNGAIYNCCEDCSNNTAIRYAIEVIKNK